MEARASHEEDDIHADNNATAVVVTAVVVIRRSTTMPCAMSTAMPHAHESFVGHNKSAQFTPRLCGRQDILQRQIFHQFVRHLLRPSIIPPRKRPPAGGEQCEEDETHWEGMMVAAVAAAAAAVIVVDGPGPYDEEVEFAGQGPRGGYAISDAQAEIECRGRRGRQRQGRR